MKNENRFQWLVNQARSEAPPSVDVASRVIAILSAGQTRPVPVSERPLMWLAAISSAVAVPTTVLAIIVYNNWVGPLFELSQVISWVTQ